LLDEQIDQVFWYEKRHSMVVTYHDGDPDRSTDTRAAAYDLAKSEGLVQVPGRQGILRWVRNPKSRHQTWCQDDSIQEGVRLGRGQAGPLVNHTTR
jgi:hypothetical protein